MAHCCSTLVVACVDWRFHDSLNQWAKGRFGANGYDVCHVAGGAGSFLNPQAADFMLWQLDLVLEKHGVQHVVLVNHLDCGAYGGRAAFSDDQAERRRHIGDLKQIAELVNGRHPHLQVTTLLHQVDGSIVAAL